LNPVSIGHRPDKDQRSYDLVLIGAQPGARRFLLATAGPHSSILSFFGHTKAKAPRFLGDVILFDFMVGAFDRRL
jgi:hypothetical protein